MRGGRAALALGTLALVACAGGARVERAYDGHVVEGSVVQPEAYAAFLRGALAEAEGKLDPAADAYAEAAELQPGSPEVWTRLAAVACARDARSARAEAALSRALSIDPGFAPAWLVRARCATARGDLSTATSAASRAAALDPGADGATVVLVRAGAAGGRMQGARERLLALTLTARDTLAAWDALAAWAASAGDVPLWGRALRAAARMSSERRLVVAAAAEDLARAGYLAEARAVAAAAVDVGDDPLPRPYALAARLAVDEALARHDVALARERSTSARVPLEEVAARALLAGDASLARRLSAPVVAADPSARGARLVLAVCDGGDLTAAALDARHGDAQVTEAAHVAFGVALARALPAARVRDVLSAIPAEAPIAGDDRVERPAVALASRGALDPAKLSAEGAIELAALTGNVALAPDGPVDARHELLALALRDPRASRAQELALRLAGASRIDPIVAAAGALVQLNSGAPIAPDAPRALLRMDAADPLLAAIALRLAEHAGDSDAARRARATLTVVGRMAVAPVD